MRPVNLGDFYILYFYIFRFFRELNELEAAADFENSTLLSSSVSVMKSIFQRLFAKLVCPSLPTTEQRSNSSVHSLYFAAALNVWKR